MKRSNLNPRIRQRDNHECYFCKKNVHDVCEKEGSGNTIHHIIPKRFGGKDEPDNLITICLHCHQKLEKLITKTGEGRMKSKIVPNVIKHELQIWKEAYPQCSKALEKFANKLIFELSNKVKDPIMVGNKNNEVQDG